MIRYAIICLAFVAVAATADADVWHVDVDNCPGPGSGSAGDPFCHIRDAIGAAAASGDEIEVVPGTYEEEVNFGGKAIVLRSSGGPEVTTIDGRNRGRVVTCQDIDAAGTVLEGFTITGGQGASGGGMFVRNADLTVRDCIFLANTAGSPVLTDNTYGGGMYLIESDATVVNCSFLGNSASAVAPAPTVKAWGGGICVDGGSLTVINSTFNGNSASASTMGVPGTTAYAYGGGIANKGGDLTVINCTFCRNLASASATIHQALGAGVCAPSGGTTSVTNCIFYDNRAGTPAPDVYGAVSVSHSCTFPNPLDGTDIIREDPRFVDADGPDDILGTEDDDVHLQVDSPCINTGDNEAVPGDITADFEGDDRIRHCRVDMGVDETPYIGHDCNDNGTADACEVTVLYIDDDAAPGGNGHTWATALDDLRPTLLSLDCTVLEIRVAGGTYTPGSSRTDTFRLRDGLPLRGGYRGLAGGGDPNDRGFESILSGDIPGANSYHVVTGSGTNSTAVLDGFTIIAGDADGDEPHNCGGGMYVSGGSPTVTDCVFSGNSGDWGGGMGNIDSNPKVTNCAFIGNSSGTGGGMSNRSSDPKVTSCTFIGNSASSGGAMDNTESNPTVTNCEFIGNTGSYGGGGMYNYHSTPVVANCTFSGNTTTQDGGGMRNEFAGSPIITNCTFSGNSASMDGGAIANWYSSPILSNCILWGNTVQPDPEIVDEQDGTTTALFSCIQDDNPHDATVFPGPGNIDDDPQLVDADGPDGVAGSDDDNLRLSYGSPCINTGLAGGAEIPETDLDGHPRVLCQLMDKGAYEFGIGDFQCDGKVNLSDFAIWESCMTGPSGNPYSVHCEAIDFEYDGDVDLDDFALFQRVFGGP